jgi:hypothetical protein
MDNFLTWVQISASALTIFAFLKEHKTDNITVLWKTTTVWDCVLYVSIIVLMALSFKSLVFPSRRRYVVRNKEGTMYYLIEGKTSRHIPDEDTFDYLSKCFTFYWQTAKKMSQHKIDRRFQEGPELPSIKKYEMRK